MLHPFAPTSRLPPAGHSSPVPTGSGGGSPASDVQGPGPSGDGGWPAPAVPYILWTPPRACLQLRLTSVIIFAFSCKDCGHDCSHDHWGSISPSLCSSCTPLELRTVLVALLCSSAAFGGIAVSPHLLVLCAPPFPYASGLFCPHFSLDSVGPHSLSTTYLLVVFLSDI